MDNKILKLKQATAKVKKITLYHIITPIDDKEITQIKESGYFNPSTGALGGQSDGYYFFTTRVGAENHIKNMRDTWDISNNKNAYIVECEINMDDIKYPKWKLDYESMQDFLFEMIYNATKQQKIKVDNIEISSENKKLLINANGRFSRIDEFNANDHSGLIEIVSDYLYKHNAKFKQEYDKLLQNIFNDNDKNAELFAVKTTTKQKITKITKIENEPVAPTTQTKSQIDKFMSRYGKSRH